MKKYLFVLIVVLLAVYSCQEKQEISEEVAKISLSSPADNAVVPATVDNDVAFEWTTAGTVGEVELVLSLSQRLINPQTIKIPEGSSLTVSGRDFMDRVIALGIEEGLETRVYWSVRPTASGNGAETEVRSMKVTCSFPTIVLDAPANLITIDGNVPDFPYEFSCTPVSSIEDYVIRFSLDEAFPDNATVEYDVPDGKWSMTEERFYGLMDGLGVTGSETVYVYWTIASADASIVVSVQTRSFTARKSAMKNAVASWTFDDPDNPMKASLGADMIPYGTVTAISGPGKGNGAVTVAAGKENYLKAIHGIQPNGGSQKGKVNEYTIMMDIRVPVAGWNALIHTDVDRGGNEASRLQLSGDDLGNHTCAPTYNGEWTGLYLVEAMKWHRLIVTSKCGVHWDVYVNGEYALKGNVADYAQLDSGWALETEGVLFCADDNWVPSEQMDIAQITIWDEPLDAGTIAILGSVPQY